MVEDADADYHRLVNSVERHTRCSSAYCLRQKYLGVPAECRFGFPKGKAQETAHMLLSMPLTGCTYSLVTISLDNSRKVVIDNENQSDEVLQKTANSRCHGLTQLNLMQYVSQYTKYRSQVRKLSVPYIVRTFPKVSGNPCVPDFGRYCKYQLITFKPWEGEPSNAWGNEAESDEMFIKLILITYSCIPTLLKRM